MNVHVTPVGFCSKKWLEVLLLLNGILVHYKVINSILSGCSNNSLLHFNVHVLPDVERSNES